MAMVEYRSRRHFVRPIDLHIFEVIDNHLSGVVVLNVCTCTCKDFNYYDMPCSHVIAATRYRNIDPYTQCSLCYNIQVVYGLYAKPIFLVGPILEWPRGDDYKDIQILPPICVTQVGHHWEIRIPSIEDVTQIHKCIRCGMRGHN
ncbi:uncharacterized protein LOC120079194 [Benincasa hispida]|uniref:uncharacterized protein LOC120079194 n=1 Tax=Benincasa hispida TaxID=102211 RepID=UPI001901EDF6|nr:uncharacterized protein LOC120079194 [Benincasa hispida]